MHVDYDKREIIFTAGGKEKGNPYHVYLYKVNFNGDNLICLTPETGISFHKSLLQIGVIL